MERGNHEKHLTFDWGNIGLLTLVHVAALGGLALYLPLHGLTVAAAATGLVLTGLTIFSISAGYHRLFTHRAYEAHPLFRAFLLVFGAGAFQNSVLVWAADHRRHHGHTDSDLDPYDARRGFWYSHIGWVVRKPDPALPVASVRDLERDPLVRWQHRRYGLIGCAAGLLLPALIGLAFGDLVGGFIVGAAVRLLVCYHATFTINSFAHRYGAQPYSDRSSARDSFFVALLSMGEGYHNFHHAFPADYRNGVKPHQYDPTKWVLWVLQACRMAHHLKRTPVPAIVRARLRMDTRRFGALRLSIAVRARIEALRGAEQQSADDLHALQEGYADARARRRLEGPQVTRQLRQSRLDLKEARRRFARTHAAWRRFLASFSAPGASLVADD